MSLGDRLAQARTKVAALRIKELTECLDRLGQRKSGRKNELQQRLLLALDESKLAGLRPAEARTLEAQLDMVIRVVDDAHLKMQRERPHWTLSDPAERAYYASLAPAAAQPAAAAPPPPQPPAPRANGGIHPGAGNAYMVMAGRPAPAAGAPAGGRQQTINFGQAAAAAPQPPQQQGAGAWPQYGAHQQPGVASNAQTNGVGALYRQAPGLGGAGHVNGYGSGAAGTSGAHVASSTAIRCICGEAAERGEMVQCQGCGTWQHGECMALPVLAPGQRRVLTSYYCERCRMERADPFWQGIVTNLMQPGKLKATGKLASCGTKNEPVQYVERSFATTPSQYDMFKKNGNVYRMQACCLQLNDTVPFRFHWPCCADLRVNNTQYRVYGRASHTKLGANQRDEPANIGVLCTSTRNRMSLQCSDPAPYVLLLQLAKQRTLEEVKALMKPTLVMDEAVAWVKKQMRGGGDEEDEDLEITHTRLSLKCPLSGTRISTPARFVDVSGLNCFDLDTFLLTAQRSRKWQCPHTMRNSCVQQLQVDTYVAAILDALKGQPDVSEVDIGPDGRWRPAGLRKGAEASWVEPGGALPPLTAAGGAGAAAGGGGTYVKPEPQENGGTGVMPGGGGADSDEESEDPAEELRKAVAAMKRGRPPSPEVITIDSDDDLGPVQPSRAPGTGGGGTGAGPSSQQQPNGPPAAKRPAVGPGPAVIQQQQQQPHVPPQPPGGASMYQAVYGGSAAAAAAGRPGIAPPLPNYHMPPQPPPAANGGAAPVQPPLPPPSSHYNPGPARAPTQWNPPLPFPVVPARPQQSGGVTEGSGESTPGRSGQLQGSAGGGAGGGGLRITIRPPGSNAGAAQPPRAGLPFGAQPQQQGPVYGGQQLQQGQQGRPYGTGAAPQPPQQQPMQGVTHAGGGASHQPYHQHQPHHPQQQQPQQQYQLGSSHAQHHHPAYQQGPGYVVSGGAGGVPAMQRGGSAPGGMPLGLAVLSTAAAAQQPYRQQQQPPQPPTHQHQQQQGAVGQWQQRAPGTGAAPAAAPARNTAPIDIIEINDSDDD